MPFPRQTMVVLGLLVLAGGAVRGQSVYAPTMAPPRPADYELWSDVRRAFEREQQENGTAPAQPDKEEIEWQLLTPEERVRRVVERNLGRFDRGVLNRVTLGVSNGARASIVENERKWAAHTADERARHELLIGFDPAYAKRARQDYYDTAYRRRHSLLWDPNVRRLMDRR